MGIIDRIDVLLVEYKVDRRIKIAVTAHNLYKSLDPITIAASIADLTVDFKKELKDLTRQHAKTVEKHGANSDQAQKIIDKKKKLRSGHASQVKAERAKKKD